MSVLGIHQGNVYEYPQHQSYFLVEKKEKNVRTKILVYFQEESAMQKLPFWNAFN